MNFRVAEIAVAPEHVFFIDYSYEEEWNRKVSSQMLNDGVDLKCEFFAILYITSRKSEVLHYLLKRQVQYVS